MKRYLFTIKLSYLECESLYLTTVTTAIVTATTGERVQVPSISLRPFIEPTGINGTFCLTINKENKIQSFERVSG
ncbi:DUF2835 family protein [Glaciecola sp. 33A]|jgi:hypothetical protein|uniref:DUF2835 family protein n=1 Tax=Glaciecola sp. 33A TaxID=2057807 RepID=UPI000C329C46|nr:DUF2835 family protein [Glaciecola sp. 33A]PKI00189.1 DUF2835 domain-containing protein [Glaciecola sp. 33A]